MLNGTWSNGRIKGTWVKSDQSDQGTWEGERSPASAAAELEPEKSKSLGALYEWRRPPEHLKRYELEGKDPGKGWIRSERPLCRVWNKPIRCWGRRPAPALLLRTLLTAFCDELSILYTGDAEGAMIGSK